MNAMTENKCSKISVIGCGRWGSFLAWYASARLGFSVLMQGREGSASYETLRREKRNEYVTLPDSVRFTPSLREALDFEDDVIGLSCPA